MATHQTGHCTGQEWQPHRPSEQWHHIWLVTVQAWLMPGYLRNKALEPFPLACAKNKLPVWAHPFCTIRATHHLTHPSKVQFHAKSYNEITVEESVGVQIWLCLNKQLIFISADCCGCVDLTGSQPPARSSPWFTAGQGEASGMSGTLAGTLTVTSG